MFRLADVVPWGRSFDEYRRMFMLSDADLGGRILGCGDGPSSFNAEAKRRGTRAFSVDPIYRCTVEDIRARIQVTTQEVVQQTRRNVDQFVWDTIRSVEELQDLRLRSMATFLNDFNSDERSGRYVAGALPNLPFGSGQFDLALCSHFLFLYSPHLSAEFHYSSIIDLIRVAAQVRIFPLVALEGRPSPHLPFVVEKLVAAGHSVNIETVPYEFQRGANQMMRVQRGDGASRS